MFEWSMSSIKVWLSVCFSIRANNLFLSALKTSVSSLSKKSISHEHLNIKDISYQQTVSSSLTEPTHISLDADSNSRSSMIRNSVMATNLGGYYGGNRPTETHLPCYSCFPSGSVAPSCLLCGLWPNCGCWREWRLFVEVAAEVRQVCVGARSEPRPWARQ